VQALSVVTGGVGLGSYQFDETANITATRAWHLPQNESVRRSRVAPVDIAVGEAFLTTSKARLIPVDNVKKGSLVFFEFEAREKPYFLTLAHLFFENAPVVLARFELELPPGWSARWAWIQGKGPEPTVAGPVRSWEMRDLPAPVKEDLAPPPEQEASLLGVNLSPPSGASVAPAAFPDWVAVSRWYEGMARGREAVTPAIEAAAKRAPSDGDASALERTLASATMVRDRVRYVAVELGIGGFQPRPAADTLSNLYGDCKDKGILLQSILSAGGIASYPLLVNLGGRMSLPAELPIWVFNHLVLAATIPQDVSLPARYESAVLKDPDFGRLLVLDSTDEFTPAGSLSVPLAGQRAVLVAGARGKLVTLPSAEASSHRLERHLDVTVLPDGVVSVRAETRLFGEFGSEARAGIHQSSIDRRRTVEGRWTRLWPGATVEDYSVEAETTDGAFVEKATISRVPPTTFGTEMGLSLFPGASWDLDRVPLGKRKNPVDYGFPRTLHYQVSIQGVPPGAVLPKSQLREGDGWAVETRIRRDGFRVEAVWEIRLSRARFDPEHFQELRKFWSAASMLDSGMVQVAP
jgi:transglutaminase-like putative cysteine protease